MYSIWLLNNIKLNLSIQVAGVLNNESTRAASPIVATTTVRTAPLRCPPVSHRPGPITITVSHANNGPILVVVMPLHRHHYSAPTPMPPGTTCHVNNSKATTLGISPASYPTSGVGLPPRTLRVGTTHWRQSSAPAGISRNGCGVPWVPVHVQILFVQRPAQPRTVIDRGLISHGFCKCPQRVYRTFTLSLRTSIPRNKT